MAKFRPLDVDIDAIRIPRVGHQTARENLRAWLDDHTPPGTISTICVDGQVHFINKDGDRDEVFPGDMLADLGTCELEAYDYNVFYNFFEEV